MNDNYRILRTIYMNQTRYFLSRDRSNVSINRHLQYPRSVQVNYFPALGYSERTLNANTRRLDYHIRNSVLKLELLINNAKDDLLLGN